jgi:hypothetical protein
LRGKYCTIKARDQTPRLVLSLEFIDQLSRQRSRFLCLSGCCSIPIIFKARDQIRSTNYDAVSVIPLAYGRRERLLARKADLTWRSLQRIRLRRLPPSQDGDTRVPGLINFSASNAVFYTRLPERRSTVRPSRYHLSQTSSIGQCAFRKKRVRSFSAWPS